jgi:integrase
LSDGRDVNTTHHDSPRDPRRRERIAENTYRRVTKSGTAVYEVVFRDVDGRQRTRRLQARTERAAIREARGVLVGRDGGQRVVPANVTIDGLANDEWFPLLDSLVGSGRRSERHTDDIKGRYRVHVEPRLGHMLLGDVEPRHIAALLRAMRSRKPRPYAEATIANVLNVIRALYRLAQSRGYISRSPVAGLDPTELPRPTPASVGRVLNEAELAALVRHVRPRYRAVVTVLAYTGLRLSEALGLRWGDIDFVEGELNVRGQLQPAKRDRPARWVPLLKSAASERTVPLFPAVTAALVEQLADEQTAGRGADTDLVFCSRTGRPLVHRNVAQRGVENGASRAGLGKVTPHDLRRSFCSLAGRRGVDPVEAAQITGHSPAVWARFYARSFGKAQRDEARDRLLEYGFGAVSDAQVEGPLAPRSHSRPADDELSREVDAEAQKTPANKEVPEGGAYRDRTGDLRLAKPALSQLS